MKKGIRCNETQYTPGKKRDQIRYEFVSDDGNTASSCTVRLGDIDPMTGERITNLDFFREYYRLVDHQVMKNLRAVCPADSPAGPEHYCLSLDFFEDEDSGESFLDRCAAFSVPSFADEEESLQQQALREVATSLSGRKADVLEMMLQKAAGGSNHVRHKDLADKWNVSPKRIMKDREEIIERIKTRASRIRDEFENEM